VVLYLVNSAELPQDAGYLPAEMKILAWLGKPVVVLLNQLGPPRPAVEEQAELRRWQEHLAQFGIVREVLALDAFARCWVHERVFYEAVGELIAPDKRDAYARLLDVWRANNQTRFAAAMRVIADQLGAAARDSEVVATDEKGFLRTAMSAVGLAQSADQQRQEKAMAVLVGRLEQAIGESTRELLRLHQLDPGNALKINARVRDNFKVRAPVDKAQAGLWGAVVSGAATGLSADLMAGGLTFGAGALLGGVVGALTMAGAAWGFNATTDRNRTSMSFADDFLRTLLTGSVLRYLAVAHFGRGRGNFVEGEAPAFWQVAVEAAVVRHDGELAGLWPALRQGGNAGALEKVLTAVSQDVLAHLYPATM